MKVLYICIYNCCRSILFEVIINYVVGDVIIVKSVGSQFVGEVYLLLLKYFNEVGILMEGLQS